MNRLIDTMTEVELSSKVIDLLTGWTGLEKGWKRTNALRQELEKLFAPVPHWSDTLNHYKEQTWVLCWLSDECPKETRYVGWVSHVNNHRYEMGAVNSFSWKYATPVDLGLRYGNGEDTL